MKVDNNPIQHFQKWFYYVEKSHPEDEVNAMLLSTIGTDGYPKNRIVLLKRYTWQGFIFFTNYNSDKGRTIAKNNNVSITFNWVSSKREVHIYGQSEKISEDESQGYFDSRPQGSKLSTWASYQSKVVDSRKSLENRLNYYETKFKNQDIPKPKYWGGYIIKPTKFEFIKHFISSEFAQKTTYKLQPDYNWSKRTYYVHL